MQNSIDCPILNHEKFHAKSHSLAGVKRSPRCGFKMKSAVLVVALMSGLCADSMAAVLNAETRGASPVIALMAVHYAPSAPAIESDLNFIPLYSGGNFRRASRAGVSLVFLHSATSLPGLTFIGGMGCATLFALFLFGRSSWMYAVKRHRHHRHRRQTGRRMMA
jgi:hypothetical protein